MSSNDSLSVLAISGSLRAGSHNTTLLRGAATLAGPGVTVELLSGLDVVPPFNEDGEHEPSAEVLRLREAIERADAVLIATPEYNSGIPGQLKNAVDWASRPTGAGVFAGKPVAVVGVSPSDYGAAWARQALCTALESCGAEVVGKELCVPRSHEAFGADGLPLDAELRERLTVVLADLTAAVRERVPS